jgi:glycerol kinase
MAYGTAEMLTVMAKRGKVSFESLRVDGGASANNWLLQFQSDILGISVERPDMIETTALGAAGLAGIAGGVWRDATEFIGTRQFTRFAPVMPRESAAALLGEWQRAVRAALFWARDRGPAEPKRRGARKSKAKSRSAQKSKGPRPVAKARPKRGRSK